MSKIKSYLSVSIFISILIICSFGIGFYFQENSSGGATEDFIHVLNNFNIFYYNSFFTINWIDYESSALPLYYIVTSIFYNPDNLVPMRIFSLVIAVSSLILFFLILKMKLQIDKSLTFMISTTILLSPYFRTSTFWIMEENFPILMNLISFYIYFNLQKKFNYFYLFLTIFFSACAFFSRQNYIVLSFILFLLIFDWDKYFSKKNFVIVLYYLIIFSPILYFYHIWNGLVTPTLSAEKRALIFNFNNFPYVMNIILIYLIPFLLIDLKNLILFFKKNILTFILSFIIYLTLFYNFNPQIFGGGAINKLLFLFFDGPELKYLTIIISFVSILFSFFLFRNNKIIQIYFILNILLFCTIDPVWQEYFDPISLIFLMIFGNKLIKANQFLKFSYILVAYMSLFLSASIIDQNFIST